ncbi:MAG: heme exporter protein CcmB [Pseudomonadota bacterium]
MTAIFLRDLRLALRSGGGFGLTLAFFLIVIFIVPLGIGLDTAILARIAPGILWIGALLSCLLSLDRLFQLDFEDGSLDALLTAPIPVGGLVATKTLAHWITTGLPLTLAAIPLGALLYLPSEAYLWITLSLLVGTPALSAIGAFGAALTVGVKRGGLLLSLLVIPLYLPTLIFGAQTVLRAMDGQDPFPPLMLTAGITFASLAAMPFAASFALRANTN